MSPRGVSGEYWTVLRRLGTSRHPIDAVVGASSAVNYLSEVAARGESVSRRDILAVGRLQRALCQIALRNYPFSSKALDLIAVLCRWEVDAPLGYMTSVPTGRRIGRALDRAIRTYVSGELMDPMAYSMMYRQIAEKAVGQPLKATQTSTTSTATLLRLVRVIAMFESDEDAVRRRGRSGAPRGTSATRSLVSPRPSRSRRTRGRRLSTGRPSDEWRWESLTSSSDAKRCSRSTRCNSGASASSRPLMAPIPERRRRHSHERRAAPVRRHHRLVLEPRPRT